MPKSKQQYIPFFCALIFSFQIKAQELQATVSVNASRINTTINKKTFNTLQTQLANFLNGRRWTNDAFSQNEKISCTFLLNLASVDESNVYSASLTIQAARPVYNTTYQAALINFQDKDLTFKYLEFQPLEFNDNRVQGNDIQVSNLTAVFAYYAYLIIALDYDSFSPKSGDVYFQKVQNIINNAPLGNGITGWQAFDGLRNRYWLSENFTNSRDNVFHDVIYNYYRMGLDKLYDNEAEARSNILKALTQLQNFNLEFPNSMFVDFFMQGKSIELIGIFKNGTIDEKQKAIDVLSQLDVANSAKYKDELK